MGGEAHDLMLQGVKFQMWESVPRGLLALIVEYRVEVRASNRKPIGYRWRGSTPYKLGTSLGSPISNIPTSNKSVIFDGLYLFW